METYGYALINSGQAEKALGFEGIYDVFGDTADFNFLMGMIYMNNERFDEAISQFLKATQYTFCRVVGVNSYLAYYNVGVIYECLGHKSEALKYYRKCEDYKAANDRIMALLKWQFTSYLRIIIPCIVLKSGTSHISIFTVQI